MMYIPTLDQLEWIKILQQKNGELVEAYKENQKKVPADTYIDDK